MTAREDLIKTLQLNPEWESTKLIVDTILNAHARELAEKIRSEGDHSSYAYISGWEFAADLIDPEVDA